RRDGHAGLQRRPRDPRPAPLRTGLGFRAPVVARQAVVLKLVPGRARRDEQVELRPDPGVAVERPEADRDLVAFRPFVAEQARAADRAERLHAPAVRPVDADQLLAREQAEALARDPPLGSAERARVLAATRAVAVVGPEERSGRLEPGRQRGRTYPDRTARSCARGR